MFSVVTSFHDTPLEYVKDVSSSLLNQTYTDWEWVITDDSDTLSQEILDLTREDSRIRYVSCKTHELYWNPHLFSRKDAKVIVVLDADDMIAPKFLEVTKNIYDAIPNDISCVHYNSLHYNERFDPENFEKLRNCTPWSEFLNYRQSWLEYYVNYGKRLGELWGGIRTYRNYKDLRFISEEQYKDRIPIGEDILKILYLETKGNIMYVDRPLHYVRVKEKSGRLPSLYKDAYSYYLSVIPNLKYANTLERSGCPEFVRSTAFSSLITEWSRCSIKFVPSLCNTSKCIFRDHDIIKDDRGVDYLFYYGNTYSTRDLVHVIESQDYGELNILLENDNGKHREEELIRYLLDTNVVATWYIHGNYYVHIRIRR